MFSLVSINLILVFFTMRFPITTSEHRASRRLKPIPPRICRPHAHHSNSHWIWLKQPKELIPPLANAHRNQEREPGRSQPSTSSVPVTTAAETGLQTAAAKERMHVPPRDRCFSFKLCLGLLEQTVEDDNSSNGPRTRSLEPLGTLVI